MDDILDIIENYDVEFSIKVSSIHNHNLCYKKEDILYLDKKKDKELIKHIKDKINNDKINIEKELERV